MRISETLQSNGTVDADGHVHHHHREPRNLQQLPFNDFQEENMEEVFEEIQEAFNEMMDEVPEYEAEIQQRLPNIEDLQERFDVVPPTFQLPNMDIVETMDEP